MKKEFALVLVFAAGMLVAESVPWTSQPEYFNSSEQGTVTQISDGRQEWVDSLYPKVAIQSHPTRTVAMR